MLSSSIARDKKSLVAFLAAFTVLLAGLLLYVQLNVDWIVRTTAIPTYDQSGYVIKTFAIATRISRDAIQALNPLTYLSDPFANRPPLMMALAAWVFGPTFNFGAIAMLWFVLRMIGLLLALVFLAHKLRNAWWIPAATLAILSAPGWLRVYPNLLMMDQPFEVGVLLAFAAIVWDLRARTWKSALLAFAGFFIAAMIKAVAPILFFPWFCFLIWQLVRKQMNPPRLAVYLGGLAVLVAVALSPLGPAVVAQYVQGMQGWWAFPLTMSEKLLNFFLILPWWLLLASVPALIMHLRRPKTADAPASTDTRWVWLPALVLIVWWFIFNAFISYTMDVRIVPAVMPVAITAVCIWLVSSRRRALILTCISTAFFAWSLAIASGRAPAIPAVPWVTPQKPIAEVGLFDIAAALNESCPPQTSLLINIDDHFVETSAISLAWYQLSPGPRPKISTPRWGVTPNLATKMSGFDFILLKKKNSTSELAGNSWASLHAVEDLIRLPESPISAFYQPVWTLPTHQPDYDDEVTLYARRGAIAPAALAAADAFADQRQNAESTRTHAR